MAHDSLMDLRRHTLRFALCLLLAPSGCDSSPSPAGDASDSTSGLTSDATGDESPYPPGCSDGGGPLDVIVRSDTEIVITTLFAGCGNPEEVGRACSIDDFEYVMTFTDGIAEGTYDLSDPQSGVSYARVRHWDHSQSDAGCFCDGEVDDGVVPFDSGTVTISTTNTEGYVWGLQMDGVEPFTGGSLIPEPCE